MKFKILLRRSLAAIIDIVLSFFIFAYSLTLSVIVIPHNEQTGMILEKYKPFIMAGMAVYSFLPMLFKDIFGVSLGKLIMGLKIVNADDAAAKVKLWKRVVRNLTLVISDIEFIFILITGKRISDKLLHLKVVSRKGSSEDLSEISQNTKLEEKKMNDTMKWFNNRFMLHKNEKYRNSSLSDETKNILCDIGLPEEPLHLIRFDVKSEEITKLNDLTVIGDDYGTSICINENDEILSVDPEGEYPERFINKDLDSFLSFIREYYLFECKAENSGEDEIASALAALREKFNAIDAGALSNEENWWSVVLEQTELEWE